jgi:hypothetical protein
MPAYAMVQMIDATPALQPAAANASPAVFEHPRVASAKSQRTR